MTLAELIGRLPRRDQIDGLAVIGSAAEGNLSRSSDYDLLIVLRQMPVAISGGVTLVDGRLTDLLVVEPTTVDRVASSGKGEIRAASEESSLVKWMETADIRVDRCGCLGRLKAKVRSVSLLGPETEGELLSRLDKASYNVAHTVRMAASSDPVYSQAIDLRMLYQLSDLMVDYFVARGIPYEGEKAAIRHWSVHDPDYLDLFTRCVSESDRKAKVGLYQELASLTHAPVGELWETGVTSFRLNSTAEMTKAGQVTARQYWGSLVGN